jgi:GPH family glycoside/pentoside/hexuronide:cation symporter
MRSQRTAWMYALGMLGIAIPVMAFENHIVYHYVEELGLALSLAGLARTINSVWNAVNDPIFGYLSDKTRTRWGRRRPWMVLGLPLFLASFILGFWVPGPFQSGMRLFWYFLAVLVLQETFATVMWTNYSSLFPELFKGHGERSRAAAMKHGFQLVAMVIGIALVPVIKASLGAIGMVLLLSALSALCVPVSVAGCPEDPSASAEEPLGLVDSFVETLTDRAFWVYSLAATMTQFTFGLMGAGMTFYAKYTLGLSEGMTTVLFGAVFLMAIPTVGLWSTLARRWGGKRAWLASLVVLCVASVLLALSFNLWTGILGGAVFGLGMSGVLVMGEVIMAWVIDRDAERTGRRREGIYYAVGGFVTRISGALQGLAFGALTLLFGYVSSAEPGAMPGHAFRFFMSAYPFLACAIALVIARHFPADVRDEPGHRAA